MVVFYSDHVAFLLLKLACSDIVYWMPGVGAIFSTVFRFVAKVVADFTGTLFIPRHNETALPTSDCALWWQD